jgi:hypothetical protein
LRAEAEAIDAKIAAGGCSADAAAIIVERPVCLCGSGLGDLRHTAGLPARFSVVVDSCLRDLRVKLLGSRDVISKRGRQILPGSNIDFFLDSLAEQNGFPRLSSSDMILLSRICAGDPARQEQVEVKDVEAELLAI